MKPGGPAPGGEGLRARIAGARDAIERSLRDVAAEVQHDEMELRAKAADELARIASAELERALREYESEARSAVSAAAGDAAARAHSAFAERAGQLSDQLEKALDEHRLEFEVRLDERTARLKKSLKKRLRKGAKRNTAGLDAGLKDLRARLETMVATGLAARMDELQATASSHDEARFSALEESLTRRIETLTEEASHAAAEAADRRGESAAAELRVDVDTTLAALRAQAGEVSEAQAVAVRDEVERRVATAEQDLAKAADRDRVATRAAAAAVARHEADSRLAAAELDVRRWGDETLRSLRAEHEATSRALASQQEATLATAQAAVRDTAERRSDELEATLRDRVAAAESALSDAARVQRDEFAANAEALVSSRLSDAVKSLGERGELKLEAVSELTSSALSEIKKAREGLARQDRRQELKLVRAESSRRVRRALAELEQKGQEHAAAVRAEGERASEMLQAAEQRVRDATAQLERGEGEAGERVAAAIQRADMAVGRIEQSQSHVTELEGAAQRAATQATRAAELAADAAALELRVREAIEREESTAEQMSAIERRLLDLLNGG